MSSGGSGFVACVVTEHPEQADTLGLLCLNDGELGTYDAAYNMRRGVQQLVSVRYCRTAKSNWSWRSVLQAMDLIIAHIRGMRTKGWDSNILQNSNERSACDINASDASDDSGNSGNSRT